MVRVLLLLAACCSVARAALNFLEVTDLVGFRTVFEEGDGLPTDNFTLSLMCRKNNRNRIFTMSSDWDLSEYYENVEGTSDLMLDYSSNVFATADVYTNQTGRSEDELLLEWHMWSYTWSRGAEGTPPRVCQYIDDLLIECVDSSTQPFNGSAVFGPAGVSTLIFGQYGPYIAGEYTQVIPQDQFRGRMKLFQLYDYALSSDDIAAMFAAREGLTGAEPGLQILLRMDDGAGSVLPNLGAAGRKYDGVRGAYASGVNSTSTVLGNEPIDCVAVAATAPAWPTNRSADHAPITDDAQYDVAENTASAGETSTQFFVYARDSLGALYLAQAVISTASMETQLTVKTEGAGDASFFAGVVEEGLRACS